MKNKIFTFAALVISAIAVLSSCKLERYSNAERIAKQSVTPVQFKDQSINPTPLIRGKYNTGPVNRMSPMRSLLLAY